MAQDNISARIGSAWDFQRKGRYDEAVSEFETLAASAPDNVDAHYGLALAQRSAGQTEAAIGTFRTALDLASTRLNELRSGDLLAPGVANDLKSAEDDRYMMIVRMISQRLAELGVRPGHN